MSNQRKGLLKVLGHWRWFLFAVIIPVLKAKMGYCKSLRRVRGKFGREKLRVLFVVGQVSKWKCQSIYALMLNSDEFEPLIVLTICDYEREFSSDQRRIAIEEKESYFAKKGMRCVRGYSVERGCNLPIVELSPDLVFYSQPWNVAFCQYPYSVAHRALTFFVPYYVTNLESVAFACDSPFQRSVFEFIALNESVARTYARWCMIRSGHFCGLGHPALDSLQKQEDTDSGEYVIFAPHWSFDHPGNLNSENYSTFLETGKPMLQFAEAHPEIKWVFKPHPTLRSSLVNSGAWSEEEIDDYYSRWERVGTACYDGTYGDYFRQSLALVTDCGSFLVEYACTGRPLLHLISATRNVHAVNGLQPLFDTYYQIHDRQELLLNLKEIVLNKSDPKRDVRLAAIQDAGLVNVNAASAILTHLRELLKLRDDPQIFS